MEITLGDVLAEIRGLSNRVDMRFDRMDAKIDHVASTLGARLDNLNIRVDTLIDAIADIRRELVTHEHD